MRAAPQAFKTDIPVVMTCDVVDLAFSVPRYSFNVLVSNPLGQIERNESWYKECVALKTKYKKDDANAASAICKLLVALDDNTYGATQVNIICKVAKHRLELIEKFKEEYLRTNLQELKGIMGKYISQLNPCEMENSKKRKNTANDNGPNKTQKN